MKTTSYPMISFEPRRLIALKPQARRVYGGFWRWLFRHPKCWEVTYTFVVRGQP